MSDKPWAQRKRINEKGVAFGGWCFSKARRRNLVHVPELHLTPFSWCRRDEWRAPDLLQWRCGAEGVIAGDCLPTASISEARQHSSGLGAWDLNARGTIVCSQAPISFEGCCFVKMPGSGWSQDVGLFIQINSLAGEQANSLSRCCCSALR